MYIVRNFKVSRRLVNDFEKLPISRSAGVVQAVMRATVRPQVLVTAFKARLEDPSNLPNNVRINIYMPPKVNVFVKDLASMTKLPDEEVVRLCMEAYVKGL